MVAVYHNYVIFQDVTQYCSFSVISCIVPPLSSEERTWRELKRCWEPGRDSVIT